MLLTAVPAQAQIFTCLLNGTILGGSINSTACGPNASVNGSNSTAYGGSATVNGANAVAIGANSTATVSSVALGYMATASANGSVAIGSNSIANVANTVSFGSVGSERKLVNVAAATLSATSTDVVNGSQLFATNTTVSGLQTSLTATTTNLLTTNQRLATAIGGGVTIDANGVITVPSFNVQGHVYASVGGALGALDAGVTANATNLSSLSTQINVGGIGLVQQDAVTRQISVGKATDGSLVDLTGTAGTRKLTGLQSGTLSASSSDAVTGAQLYSTNASVSANTTAIGTLGTNATTLNTRLVSILGAGASIDANGVVTIPSFTIQGNNYTSIGGAFTAVDTKLTSNSADIANLSAQIGSGGVGLVQQDSVTRQITVGKNTDGLLVDLRGSIGTRTLTGLHNGSVAASSTDAVTGDQLFSTNQAVGTLGTNATTLNQRLAAMLGAGASVDANGVVTMPSFTIQGNNYSSIGTAFGAVDSKLTGNSNAIASLSTQIGSGGVGLVQQDSVTRQITVGKNTDGLLVDLRGSIGTRTLTGLNNGTIAASSTDAVTGDQLFATQALITANSNAITAINTNSSTLNQRLVTVFGGGSSIDANGVFTAPTYTVLGGSYGNIDGALTALSNRVQTNSNNISILQASAGGGGGTSLVEQDPSTRAINVASTTDGTSVNFTGTSGNRQLTGVADGAVNATSSDAVTGAQLYATNQAVAATTTYATNSATGLANAIGGGAGVDSNGNVTNPTLTVQSQTYSTVATAVGAIDATLSAHSAAITDLQNSVGATTIYTKVNGPGAAAVASGTNAIAVGAQSVSSGNSSIAIGAESTASADGALAFGRFARANGLNAIAIGSNAVSTMDNGVAMGNGSTVTAAGGVALGMSASVTAANAVAIGAGSVANTPNTVSVGAPGNERRITNVAAGINQTDAVNLGQLQALGANVSSQIQRLDQRITNNAGGVAMAMALTGSSLPSDKSFATALNVGSFAGQNALGISQYMRLTNSVVLSGGMALQSNQVGGRAGLMVAW